MSNAVETNPAATRPPPAWREFARSPLVPVAIAATIGLVADRYGPVPLQVSLFAAAIGMVGWICSRIRTPDAAIACLWLAVAALAAGYHHLYRNSLPTNDISRFATERPTPAKLRGTLDEEPISYHRSPDPLLTIPRTDSTITILSVSAIESPDGWVPASGRVRITVDGQLTGLHHGDVVEVIGLFSMPHPPSNSGEFDYRSRLLDDRIRTELRSRRNVDGMTRLEEGWRATLFGWLAAARGWGTRALQETLPPKEAAVAAALLLGETNAMDRSEWDSYVRTGVVHVLAISGQHLVILAWFVWLVLKLFGMRRRNAAWLVGVVMLGYLLLTGVRPSAVRATAMVCVLCGGIILRRPVIPANAFALAWLIVLIVNPTDPFSQGCQLSFVSVFVLIWGAGRWLAPRELTPAEQLVEETRSFSEVVLRSGWRIVKAAFAVSLILGAANAPLILAWQNIVSPIGVLLGPPLVLLTSIALLTGFLLLLVAPIGPWIAWPFARIVEATLYGCEVLVRASEQIPGAWVYAPAPAMWWLVGFYGTLVGVVLLDGRRRWYCLVGLTAWVIGGLGLPTTTPPPDELRITFLTVGDGGCVVMETPDGRVLLYDSGTISGPDIVRRTIAPYLWARGIRHIDEVFISHADLDHYNGLPQLMDRFPVGQVTMTPSFREKPIEGVSETLAAIEHQRVPLRIARSGDQFTAGPIHIEVLHPPESGPIGNENSRSLVLLVRHGEHHFLLTGDLEGAGQELIRSRTLPSIDVMLAPHHGAVSANAGSRDKEGKPLAGPMASWARPRFVVSSQGPRPTSHLNESYGAIGAIVWDTSSFGAITIRSNPTGIVAEAYRTGEVKVIKRGK